jgi:aminoglycoside phosphotransferase (APT) family kinase protein
MGDDAAPGAAEVTELHRSSRDRGVLRARLEAWLTGRLPADAGPQITALDGTAANGMSSETLLMDATWAEQGVRRPHRLVARLAPAPDDVPVFPRYDLAAQFETIRLVGELTDVPVPPVLWSEPDPGPLGCPFFVMRRVDGRVPPDVLPYNFGDSWLYDASPAERRHLQDATIGVLARLHAVDRAAERFAVRSRTRRRTGRRPCAGGWRRRRRGTSSRPAEASGRRCSNAASRGWTSTGRRTPASRPCAGATPASAT